MITYPSFGLFSDKHYVFLKNVTICQLDAVSETLPFSIDNKIKQWSKMTQIVLRFNTFSTKVVHHVCSMNSFFMGESAVQKRNYTTFASRVTPGPVFYVPILTANKTLCIIFLRNSATQSVCVVVQFYPWFNFYFLLFLGMVISWRGGGGYFGIFWIGMCRPGLRTPNWHPVLKKNFSKIDTSF